MKSLLRPGAGSGSVMHRVLLLMVLVSGVLVLLSGGRLVMLHYGNTLAIETRAVNGTMADVRRLHKLVWAIEHTIGEVVAAARDEQVEEKRLISLLYNRNRDMPCRYTVNFVFDEVQDSRVGEMLLQESLGKVLRMIDVKLYTDPGLYAEWARVNVADRDAGWKPAFWSEVEQEVVVSYQQPLFEPDGEGRMLRTGMVTVRMPFRELLDALDAQDIGSYGYRFVVDSRGVTLAHPDMLRVSGGRNILKYARQHYSSWNAGKLERALTEGGPLTLVTGNAITGQKSLLRFEPVGETGWLVGMSLVTGELGVPGPVLKRHMLQVLTALVAFIVLLLFMVYFQRGAMDGGNSRLMKLTVGLSLVFLVGLVAVWVLEIALGASSPYEDGAVTSMSQVELFKGAQERMAKERQEGMPGFVETGVLLRSARLDEAGEVADVDGIVWQRIPGELEGRDAEGVGFPDAIQSSFEEVYRLEEDDAAVVGWRFQAKVRQDFKTDIYPFDRIAVQLRLRPKAEFGSVLFVPDLESYSILSPSSRSLVADVFEVPGWHVDNTYYRFSSQIPTIDYGRRSLLHRPVLRDLELIVSLSRDWLSSFVSVLIPVFVIFAILFSSIYMITNDEKSRKLFNFDAMRTSVIGAALTLFLVIAIQNLRGRVIPEDVLYVEKIYFLIYFAILANITIAIGVTEGTGRLLSYRNGYYMRFVYWPFYTGMLYLVTLLSFYC